MDFPGLSLRMGILVATLLGTAACACPPDPDSAVVAGAAGRFAGSASCAPCHGEIYAAWASGRHRRALRPIDEGGAPLGSFGAAAFRMGDDGTAVGPDLGGSERVVRAAYRIPGGRREDLWVRLPDGRLQVWPVSRDSLTGEFFAPVLRMSGGAEPPPSSIHFWLGAGRNADFRCYGCHATAATLTVSGTSPAGNPLPRSRWVETGVGCEACHGPGGSHVERAGAGEGRTAYGPALPAKSCEACHALREILSSPFGSAPAHPYGTDPWESADPLLSSPSDAEFRESFLPDMRPATYQQQAIALSQSGCARKGGLSCGDCHDPHGGADPLAAGGAVEPVCARCHAGIVARPAEHSGHAPDRPGPGCRDCHMARVLRGPAREPAVDHSLAPPVGKVGEIPAACLVCHGEEEQARRIVERAVPRPATAGGRLRLEIREAVETSFSDPTAAAPALASLASRADGAWFVRWSSLRRLAELPADRRVPSVRAAALACAEDPHPAVRRAALRLLGKWGAPEDAALLARRIDTAPPHEATVAALALVDMGDPDAAVRLSGLLRRPDASLDYRALAALGSIALRSRDWAAAEDALSRSLALHPIQVVPLNEIGIARWEQGRPDEARQAWRRALEWNPSYEAARRNLEGASP